MKLLNSIKRRIHELRRQKWKLQHYEGATFLLNPVNYVDRRICFQGGYEETQRQLFYEAIDRHCCDVLLDVGANFGLYSCTACLKRPNLTVHAFECDKRNYAHLFANLRLNDLIESVITHEVALGAENGTIKFTQAGLKNTGASRMGSKDGNTVVNQVRLDDYMPTLSGKIAMKMDIEGAEILALTGMKKLLESSICVIQIESFSENASKVAKMFSQYGFVLIKKVEDDYLFEKNA